MGELAAERGDGVLCTIGLGSCVGVALLDDERAVAALAHVVLPDAAAHRGERAALPAGRFADTAVPLLVERAATLGAARRRLRAVLVGGASMFALRRAAGEPDVGERNVAAVRDALRRIGIPVAAEDVGGAHGRTVRVRTDGTVRVRIAGGAERLLRAPSAAVGEAPPLRGTLPPGAPAVGATLGLGVAR